MKRAIITTLQFLLGSAAIAQTSGGQIHGNIRDEHNQPLRAATLRLQNEADTSQRLQLAATSDGSFAFDQLPYGSYQLSCTYSGFKLFRLGHLVIDSRHRAINLPVILQAAVASLKEVVITSKKPLIEQQIDRTVVNVDAMISAAGSNTLEALAKSPGVIVDPNDQISLNGKSGVLVLIDDRPTYLSGQELAAYLRSLPAGSVSQMELIANPPARYDAAGGAVINIVLKKNRAAGFNGGVNLGWNRGAYGRSNDALNLNYRTPKFNLYSNSSYGLDQSFSRETFDRFFYQPGGSLDTRVSQNSYSKYQSSGWNARLGVDYFASTSTTLGLMLTGFTHPKTDRLDQVTSRSNQITGGYTDGRYQAENGGINLNMLHRFKKAGQTLTADADYVRFSNGGDQHSVADTQNYRFLLPSGVTIYSGKLDYSQPLAGNGRFDAGIKSSVVNTDNQLQWFSRDVPDFVKSDRFRYRENINAAYLNTRKSRGRWGIQAGLRVENTNAGGHQLANPVVADSSFSKAYTHVFPSAYLSYKLDSAGSHNLVISYNERIRRPGYQQLNPFLFYRDPYTYTTGNPDLVPYYNHYFDLKYTYRQSFGITVGYSTGNNETQSLTTAAGSVFTTRPFNYINNRTYSLVPYVSLSATAWWTLRLNAVLLYMQNNGSAAGVTIHQTASVHEIETGNELQFGNGWSAEVDGFFPGKQSFGQSQGTKAGYNISGVVRKSILHNNGSISLNANDIFHTLQFGSQTIGIGDVTAFSTKATDSRRIGIAFSYRFGKASNARKRDTNGSAEDEKGRTN